MDLTTIIEDKDVISGISLEDYEDERTKVFLLYKGKGCLDVIIVPFGENIKETEFIQYIRFDTDAGSTLHTFLPEVEIKEHITEKGLIYFSVENDRIKAILPYETDKLFKDLPFRIFGNFLARKIKEVTAEIVKEYDTFEQKVKSADNPIEKAVLYASFSNRCQKMFSSVKGNIERMFKDENSPAKYMPISMPDVMQEHKSYSHIIDFCVG
ncbi:hypothetical protein HY837_00285 [archaeon]|nr:hypothetical protein [archaeon]